jgi:uncharacterized protein DUF5683
VIFLFFSTSCVTAQQYTDSLSISHSPTKATILSAVLPGAGQVYNKKYWKVPVLYAGFATLGYFIKFNNDEYKTFKEAFIFRVDGDESTTDDYVGIYSDQDLERLKDFYRRNRDLSIVGISLLYILNIIDANVDAHLFYFNVSDELTMNWQPGIINTTGNMNPGISIAINF